MTANLFSPRWVWRGPADARSELRVLKARVLEVSAGGVVNALLSRLHLEHARRLGVVPEALAGFLPACAWSVASTPCTD